MNLAFSLRSPAFALPAGEAKRLFVVKGGILFPAVYLPEGSEKFVGKKRKADSERTRKNNASCHIAAVLHLWTPNASP